MTDPANNPANDPVHDPANEHRPDHAVAIVTGAARGIGRAITERLARDGWGVVGVDLDAEGLADVEQIPSTSPLITLTGDIADPAILSRAVEIGSDMGPVVAAVANAGIFRDARIPNLDDEAWKQVIDVDLTAPFLLTRAIWHSMSAAGFGRLVFISSVSKDGNFGQANYAAAKSGLVGLARTAAIEGGKHGITSNVICPGSIDTPLNLSFKHNSPEAYQRFISRVPLGRAGQPREIAAACSWLMSEESSYVTGQVLYVDGGMSCGYS